MSETGQIKRKCAVETAQIWWDGAKGNHNSTPTERLLCMENAFNHTENALVADRAELTRLQQSNAALVERNKRFEQLLELICRRDGDLNLFDIPSGGAIRLEMQDLIATRDSAVANA